jgi:hypothetical protein
MIGGVSSVAPPAFAEGVLVLGYNYSSHCFRQPNCTTPQPGGDN